MKKFHKVRQSRKSAISIPGLVSVEAGAHKAEVAPKRLTAHGLKRFAKDIAVMVKRWYIRKPFGETVRIVGKNGSVKVPFLSNFHALVKKILGHLYDVIPLPA